MRVLTCLRQAGRKFIWIALIALIDPFGFSSATDSLSQDLALIVMAPFYRYSSDDMDNSAPITVVMIDEETLRRLGTGYPLDDEILTKLLRKIACAGPKTMFLDMLLGDPRPGGGSVSDEMIELLAAGAAASRASDPAEVTVPRGCESAMPPLYVADIPAADDAAGLADTSAVGLDETAIVAPRIRATARRLPVQWANEAYLYPTRLAFGSAREADGWATLPGASLPTPALQLFLDVERPRRDAPPPDVAAVPTEMVIGWSWKHGQLPAWYTQLHAVAPPQPAADGWKRLCGLVGTDNSPYDNAGWQRLVSALRIAASQLVLALVSPWRGWCGELAGTPPQKYIYTLIVPAWQILARASAVPTDAVKNALANRAVLIGQNVVGAADAVVSPVHGTVPGVVVHAQALDNLLNWHQRVWRPMPTIESWPSWISLGWVLGLSFLYVLNFLTAFLPVQFNLSVNATAWILSGVMLFIAFLLGYVFCLAPINWVGYLFAIFWEPVEKLLTE